MGILHRSFLFWLHLRVVIAQVTRLAKALGVELARGVLAVNCHLYPALRVVAIAAHTCSVVVCICVRALVNHFPVLDTHALLFRLFYRFFYLLCNCRCTLWFRLARLAIRLGGFRLRRCLDWNFRLLGLRLHALVFLEESRALGKVLEGVFAKIHTFRVWLTLIMQLYCLSCVNMWLD